MGPPVFEHSADEHPGDLSAEGSLTASTQWVGGVGAAEPGESTSHLEMDQAKRILLQERLHQAGLCSQQ